jgi:hypothetical protein
MTLELIIAPLALSPKTKAGCQTSSSLHDARAKARKSTCAGSMLCVTTFNLKVVQEGQTDEERN